MRLASRHKCQWKWKQFTTFAFNTHMNYFHLKILLALFKTLTLLGSMVDTSSSRYLR